MNCLTRFQWVSLFKLVMIVSFSLAVFSACKGDSDDSPTSPTNLSPAPASTPAPTSSTSANVICEFAVSCPRGGSIQVCLNPDQTGFYLMSDGRKFPEEQDEEAASYCVEKL